MTGSVVIVPMLDPSAMVPLTMVPIVISLLNCLGSRRMCTRHSSLGRRCGDRDTEQDCCHSSGYKEGIGHRSTYELTSSFRNRGALFSINAGAP